MAASDSNMDPFNEKEKGDPGRKEEERSRRIRSEGCSRICWWHFRGERWARSFLLLVAVVLVVAVVVVTEGADADDDDAAAGAAIDEGLTAVEEELLLTPPPSPPPAEVDLDDLLFFLGSSSAGLYEVDGRGSVSRAFWRADVNSDFSRRCDESMPYRESSDLISESFIDEMSGSGVAIVVEKEGEVRGEERLVREIYS